MAKTNTSESGKIRNVRKLPIFILVTLVGLALSLNSWNNALALTGHAILGLTGTAQGLAGVFLFILGLTGIFFSLKR